MSELKHCPFCGGKAKIHKFTVGGEIQYLVSCNKCISQTGWCEFENEAIESWNNRAPVLKWRSADEKLENETYILIHLNNGDYDMIFFEDKNYNFKRNEVKCWIPLSKVLETIK